MYPTADDAQQPAHESDRSRLAVWREVELLLLVLLVLGVYFARLTELTIRGEEPRWARVAQEMLDSGDYVVPRLQGQPFADRPPLNSWAMIAAAQLTGRVDLLAIRLPSVLATLAVTLLIYVYGRNYLSRGGALAAAASYATMGQIMALGRVAESDALVTFLLSAALLAWHAAYDRRRDPRLAWLGGFSLAALAALAKGPQGPVYFTAITVAYLGLRRDWGFLFSRWTAAGLALGIAIVAAWQIPFVLAVDWKAALLVWTEEGNLAARFQAGSLSRALSHWATFPLEVFGAMLPWSFMLPVLSTRWFRQNLGPARPMLTFAATAFLVAFVTCWLPVESRPRYVMPVYPCVALVVGLIIQRSIEAAQVGWWRRSWDNFLVTGVGLIVIAPIALTLLPSIGGPRLAVISQANPPAFLIVYGVAAAAAAGVALWSRGGSAQARFVPGFFAIVGFLGLSYTGPVVNMQVQTCNDPQLAVASIRQKIPAGESLVSFGHVHHLFAYYYEQPIAFCPVHDDVAPSSSPSTYFCFSEDPGFTSPTIPFAWEQVAVISCDRAKSEHPRARVIVGRRIPELADSRSGEPHAAPHAGNPVTR